MKKIIIIAIIFLLAGVFILVKYYPEKSISIELKPENEAVISDPENNENPETKTEETKKETAEVIQGNEIQASKTASEDKNIEGKISITNKLVSWGYEKADSRKIDTIIIHSSYNALGGGEYDVDGLIKEYKSYGVSPHYLIDRKGKIYQLVADKNIAYHAGESQTPDGRKSVNNFSIGIELMNTKEDSFTNEQYASLKNLIADLKSKYKIKYVLGHNQISPGRKTDPWNFEWGKIN